MKASLYRKARSLALLYRPAHRIALCGALFHLATCAIIGWFTGTLALVLLVGVPAVAFPAMIALLYPDAHLSRVAMALGFMSLTGLVIQQSGGDTEAHFSFFVMLSILVVYQDYRPLLVAFTAIVVHHLGFTLLHPQISGVTGFYVWNDARNMWGHLAVHAFGAGGQTGALCYVARMLQKRSLLEAENAALGRSLRQASDRADRDPLTGLFNRRYFDAQVNSIGPLIDAGDVTVAILVVDLDHFKLVNDRYGHGAGDDAITASAVIIKSEVGHMNCAARMGGEEFAVLMQCSRPGEELALAENIRSKIAVRPVMTEIGPIMITASVGVSFWKRGESVSEPMRRADLAMYKAKHLGRNRVVHADDMADVELRQAVYAA